MRVPVAGLIIVDGEGADTGLLVVAGQPLIELQARIARAAGVEHLVVLVDAMPAALVASIDRLRDTGLTIELARTAADAADRIHPDERLVIITGGALAPRDTLQALIAGDAVLVAVPDGADTAHLERIDARLRWTGLAALNGSLLRETARILGDWDLGPTLLRSALQAGVSPAQRDDIAIVRSEQDAQRASRQLLEAGREQGAVSRWLIAPLASLAMPWLAARHIPLAPVGLLPVILLAAGMAASLAGYDGLGFALLLLAAIPRIVAERLGRVSDTSSRWLGAGRTMVLPAFAVCTVALGWRAYDSGGEWGFVAVAFWLIVALALRPRAVPPPAWGADAETGALFLLVSSFGGQTLAGLAITLAHAVVTQYVMVRTSR